MGRLLLLCPGQGGQHPGMFDLARSHPAGARLLDACGWRGAPADCFTNAVAQPAIVAATLAMWECLRDDVQPFAVAGYSIGELACYGVAGALGPERAVALAAQRADLMDQCRLRHPGQALVALSDLSLSGAAAAAQGAGFSIAIINGEQSCVAGGPSARLDELVARVEAAGGRSTVLPVEVASHTPLMNDAVAPFRAALSDAALQAWQGAVYSGIAATPVSGVSMAVEHLSRQLAEPIRWMDCMDSFVEAGVTVALELGPGAALSRMLQSRHPQIASRSVAEFRSIDGVRAWLGRML